MRVCVVGGGPAGLGVAYFLEQAGYHDVVVFEKDDHVGGKCWTIPQDGQFYDMGAVEVTKEYKVVNALVEAFGYELATVPSGRIIDRQSGSTQSLLALYDGASKVDLLAQIAIFTLELRKLSPYLDVPGFARMPDSLKGLSFSQWLHQIGAPLLERFFWMPLTCYGYGALDAIPAVYALKFATVMPFHVLAHKLGLQELLPDELHFLEPFVHRLTRGLQSLMQSIADTFTVPPIVNATIVSIDRSTPQIKVRYRVGDAPAVIEQIFDKVVVTIPQTLANLTFLDLTTKEKDLFAQVTTIPYYTTLTSPKTFESKLYYELADKAVGALGPPPLPHVLQFARCWPQALGAVFYTGSAPGDWRPLDGAPGSIEEIVTTAISNANQKPGATMTSLEWRYFPQVPQAAIDAGFYDDLEYMQGLHGTYYAGGLLNFELVEKAMEYSKALVAKHFPVV
jgi:hypothetical protein